MLDIKLIRQNPQKMEELLRRKEPDAQVGPVLALDERLRHLKSEAETLKSRRNAVSKKIGELKRTGQDTTALMQEIAGVGDKAAALDSDIRLVEQELETVLGSLPNLPMEDVKVSHDPKDNVVMREWGQKPTFDFPSKNHMELNEQLSLFDFKRGAKISGSGWPTYCGMGAQLEWALLNYMIAVQRENGFSQWMLPLCVRPEVMFGSGQLPKFAKQVFQIHDEDYQLYMIPTAEVALNGLHRDEILEEETLPLKYMAYTPCFRREAGAAGSQERGLIRIHQFNKLELFCFTTPAQSSAVFDFMVTCAEKVLQGLKLHHRSALLVTGDMSFGAMRTIDVEVWLPGQGRYYEVSSVSNCGDYQARRSQTRYRPKEGGKPELVHTLNGSGLATSRLMVALLENNQQLDGSVILPEVLRPYLGGCDKLMPA